MTLKIGIIGAGNIGSTLARKLSAAGHTIKLANSRGPQTLTEIAAELGATAVAVSDAARDVEIVIISIPITGIALLPKNLFDGASEKLIVVDTGNYYPGLRDEPIEEIEQGMSESRWVAQTLRRPVIKVFNSISAGSLADEGRPSGAAGRIGLPVAGDDPVAKSVVMDLVDLTGFDGVDAGLLDESWRQQPGTPVYCTDHETADIPQMLIKADKARAPQIRDLSMKKMAELPKNFTRKDMISMLRAQF